MELIELAKIHSEETEKTFREWLNDVNIKIIDNFTEEMDKEAALL